MGRVYSKLETTTKPSELNDKQPPYSKPLVIPLLWPDAITNVELCTHFMNEFTVAERFFQRAAGHQPCPTKSERDCNQPEQPLSVPGKYGRETSFIQEAITINKNLDAQWSLGENYNNMGKQYYYDKQYSKPWKLCIKPTSMPIISEPAN